MHSRLIQKSNILELFVNLQGLFLAIYSLSFVDLSQN